MAAPTLGQVPSDTVGAVEVLPSAAEPHWVWFGDVLQERSVLVDLDDGRMLGLIDGGWGFIHLLFSRDGREIYVPETHYSRGSRGERTDVLTVYDARSLAPGAEVVLPPRRATNGLPHGNAAVSDDGRFAAIFNMNPATSLSIVDLATRELTAEIGTPGCSLVYPAGPRRFAMLCVDGAMLWVTLDESGMEQARLRSDPFFDPLRDPVTEKAVRRGDLWYFVSFEGFVHAVDVSGEAPAFEERWSLLDDADRADGWRIGGRQHLALHHKSGRLFSLMHRGEVDTHKHGGTELWVYDLDARERRRRVELRHPGVTYLGISLEFGQDWIWPFHLAYDWLLDASVGPRGAETVAVTQDDDPLMVVATDMSGSVAVYDGNSLEFKKRIATGNMTILNAQAPFSGAAATP